MRRLLPTVFTVFALGCAGHKIDSTNGGDHFELPRSVSLFVAVPADGSYGEKTYTGSGTATAATLAAELRKRFASVHTASSFASAALSVQAARSAGCAYVAFPTILNWEDRATEWSGKLDRIEIQIDLLEVPTGKLAHSVVLQANSAWATFGGDHPQDLLQKPLSDFADRLACKQ